MFQCTRTLHVLNAHLPLPSAFSCLWVLESKESGHELQILHSALKVQLLVTVQELPAADLAKVKEALSPGANLQSGVPCFC